ncbi:MAG: HAMP domain-containing histidine kinase [Clostridia bacterium]|nr:HAMP domain-containing histidine kinase [Clostridia bacterium]
MFFKGITKRWFVNIFLVVFLLLTVIAVCGCIVFNNYYYNGVRDELIVSAEEVVSDLMPYTDSATKFQIGAVEIAQSFEYAHYMELRIADKYGDVIATSSGFSVRTEADLTVSDQANEYIRASEAGDYSSTWKGELSTGESVMVYTKIIKDGSSIESGEVARAEDNSIEVGVIRLMVSLEKIEDRILQSCLAVVLACVAVLAISLISSIYFIRSIVRPIRDVEVKTSLIAQGNFDVRISKSYDDEIGELSDSINNMASELSETDRIKNEFISTVSHELRTPLTAIKGWGETLLSLGVDNPELTERGLQVMVEETNRLTQMVEELLGFSKIQGNRFKMVFGETDLIAQLNEAFYMYRERARREDKTMSYQVSCESAIAVADGGRIRQVFVNIIDNAIKYTQSGGIITVTARVENNSFIVAIKDSGKGIAKEDLPYVRQKFYKGRNSMSGSSGIGLAVVNEIINQHNGSLKIDSEVNVGTTVSITIPLNHNKDGGDN